jgi:hypothetical protein
MVVGVPIEGVIVTSIAVGVEERLDPIEAKTPPVPETSEGGGSPVIIA